ncbi:MAG TPA: CoA transferase, partial [Nocardioidaceae bacterium]|nr:CoA transferase [Nocardioidaceae bacterium]
TNAARVTHRPQLLAALERALAGDCVDAWVERLTAVGVPAGKVGDLADAFALAERLGLSPTAPVEGAPPQVRNPVSFSGTPVREYAAPPRLGADNDAVRRWLAAPREG